MQCTGHLIHKSCICAMLSCTRLTGRLPRQNEFEAEDLQQSGARPEAWRRQPHVRKHTHAGGSAPWPKTLICWRERVEAWAPWAGGPAGRDAGSGPAQSTWPPAPPPTPQMAAPPAVALPRRPRPCVTMPALDAALLRRWARCTSRRPDGIEHRKPPHSMPYL